MTRAKSIKKVESITNNFDFTIFFILAVFFRLIISFTQYYQIDMAGYMAWSSYLADKGPTGLYSNPYFHIVYAPFFQYFLWLTGEIVSFLNLPDLFHAYLIKLWSVLFEFLGAWLIFILAKRANKTQTGLLVALFYILNPGVFINSSIWGQFDSIPATMLLGVIVLFEFHKPNLGALLFLIAVLTKPQSGLLLPVVLYLYFKDFKFNLYFIKRLIIGLSFGIITYLAIVMPFYTPTSSIGKIPPALDPFYWLFDLYARSIKDYPYATANAFNLWTILGGQIQEDSLPFIGLSYFAWGNILLLLGLFFAFACLVKGKAELHALVYFSFLVQFSAFFFVTKMHERYLLPAIIFIFISSIFDKRHIITGVLVSICVFFNHLYIYIISFEERYWLDRWDSTALLFSALTLLAYGLSLYHGYELFIRGEKNER